MRSDAIRLAFTLIMSSVTFVAAAVAAAFAIGQSINVGSQVTNWLLWESLEIALICIHVVVLILSATLTAASFVILRAYRRVSELCR